MLKQYVVDAFTDCVFKGNPAAICILEQWLSDHLMMSITIENNLSETAFAVKEGDCYRLRWFTPGGEIDLCGHATLAAAFVLMEYYEKDIEQIAFQTASGMLTVRKTVYEGGDLFEMDFPAYELKQVPVTEEMAQAMGQTPKAAYMGRDLLCVFDDPDTVRQLTPDLEQVKALDGLLLQVTAPGTDADCISRTFGPKLHVAEDPVCGSGHCHIVPYWAEALGKKELVAYQASKRGGTLYCSLVDDRVKLAGKAALYSVAELNIEEVK